MVYDIAGLRIAIDNRLNFTTRFCEKYLSSDQTSPVDMRAAVTDEQFYAEKSLSNGQFSDGYIENVCMYRNICTRLPEYNRMLLHAAVLSYEGNGYAFLGRSGTGKSTHTGLWMKHVPQTKTVNGDKPILSYTNDEFIAYGTPWMGKSDIGCNRIAPIRAVYVLQRGEQNGARKISPGVVLKQLLEATLMPKTKEAMSILLGLYNDLFSSAKLILLTCNKDIEAAQVAYDAAQDERITQ
jgi:hypothetical protein